MEHSHEGDEVEGGLYPPSSPQALDAFESPHITEERRDGKSGSGHSSRHSRASGSGEGTPPSRRRRRGGRDRTMSEEHTAPPAAFKDDVSLASDEDEEESYHQRMGGGAAEREAAAEAEEQLWSEGEVGTEEDEAEIARRGRRPSQHRDRNGHGSFVSSGKRESAADMNGQHSPTSQWQWQDERVEVMSRGNGSGWHSPLLQPSEWETYELKVPEGEPQAVDDTQPITAPRSDAEYRSPCTSHSSPSSRGSPISFPVSPRASGKYRRARREFRQRGGSDVTATDGRRRPLLLEELARLEDGIESPLLAPDASIQQRRFFSAFEDRALRFFGVSLDRIRRATWDRIESQRTSSADYSGQVFGSSGGSYQEWDGLEVAGDVPLGGSLSPPRRRRRSMRREVYGHSTSLSPPHVLSAVDDDGLLPTAEAEWEQEEVAPLELPCEEEAAPMLQDALTDGEGEVEGPSVPREPKSATVPLVTKAAGDRQGVTRRRLTNKVAKHVAATQVKARLAPAPGKWRKGAMPLISHSAGVEAVKDYSRLMRQPPMPTDQIERPFRIVKGYCTVEKYNLDRMIRHVSNSHFVDAECHALLFDAAPLLLQAARAKGDALRRKKRRRGGWDLTQRRPHSISADAPGLFGESEASDALQDDSDDKDVDVERRIARRVELRVHRTSDDRRLQFSVPCVAFDNGCLIMWGLEGNRNQIEAAANSLLWSLSPYGEGHLRCDWSTEEMMFYCHLQELPADYPVPTTRVSHNRLYFKTKTVSEKVSASYALAASLRLKVYETSVNLAIKRVEEIPRRMAANDVRDILHASSAEGVELRKRVAELYCRVIDVNIVQDFLDVPEYFWQDDRWQNFWHRVLKYLEVRQRIDILNARYVCIQEILAVITTERQEAQGVHLTWIVIWLLALNVFFIIIREMLDRHAKGRRN